MYSICSIRNVVDLFKFGKKSKEIKTEDRIARVELPSPVYPSETIEDDERLESSTGGLFQHCPGVKSTFGKTTF